MHPHNLYETAMHAVDFSRLNTFQQRWRAKREILSYFGGTIRTKQFTKIFARHPISAPIVRDKDIPVENDMQLATAFGMMERRLDILLCRAWLSPNVFASRSLITCGHVTVNGTPCRVTTTMVQLGDVVQVNPQFNYFLHAVPKDVKDALSQEGIPSRDESHDDKNRDDEWHSMMRASLKTGKISKKPLPISKMPMKSSEDSFYFQPPLYFAPWMFIPSYLEVNYKVSAVVMHRLPNVRYTPGPHGEKRLGKYTSDIPSPFPPKIMSLAYEWFLKRCRRKDMMRRKHAMKSIHSW